MNQDEQEAIGRSRDHEENLAATTWPMRFRKNVGHV
jgi:hypothetical protein